MYKCIFYLFCFLNFQFRFLNIFFMHLSNQGASFVLTIVWRAYILLLIEILIVCIVCGCTFLTWIIYKLIIAISRIYFCLRWCTILIQCIFLIYLCLIEGNSWNSCSLCSRWWCKYIVCCIRWSMFLLTALRSWVDMILSLLLRT